jgi:serine/threonine-protein kinase HipA
MLIFGEERASRLEICLRSAHIFLLKDVEAKDLISNQIEKIKSHWKDVCEACDLSHAERNFFWGRQFMNPSIFENSKFEEEMAK